MTIMPKKAALERVKASTRASPTAVFKSVVPGHVDCYFASTAVSQDRIKRGDPELIGVFHKDSHPALYLPHLKD